MKKPGNKQLLVGILVAVILIQMGFRQQFSLTKQSQVSYTEEKLNREVLEILEVKCNSCHRKQNPFMVFTDRNVEKRAKKIYKQVYVLKRMPKGDRKLSVAERDVIWNWIKTKIN